MELDSSLQQRTESMSQSLYHTELPTEYGSLLHPITTFTTHCYHPFCFTQSGLLFLQNPSKPLELRIVLGKYLSSKGTHFFQQSLKLFRLPVLPYNRIRFICNLFMKILCIIFLFNGLQKLYFNLFIKEKLVDSSFQLILIFN